jgi:DNA-binding NarL/FixJ family response regulator
MKDSTRVFIADDHHIVLEGLRKTLEHEPDFEVVGTAMDGREAVSMIKSLKPDIAILDISMPNLDGVDATHEIKRWDETVRVLIFSMHASREHIVSLFRAGISGYVLKEEPVSDLVLALKAIREGGTYYSHSVDKILREHMKELESGQGRNVPEIQNGMTRLSAREKEVFVLLADGLTPKEIGKKLYISPKTAETHKYNIMDKLNAKSIADLTKLAFKKHLIEI